jgi:hypothetical protein
MIEVVHESEKGRDLLPGQHLVEWSSIWGPLHIHREGRGVEPVHGEILPAAETMAANPWGPEFLD